MQIDIISLITLCICLITLGVLFFMLLSTRKEKDTKIKQSNEEIIQLIGAEKLISIYETLIKIGVETESNTKGSEQRQYVTDEEKSRAKAIEEKLIKIEFEGEILTIPKTF